MKKSIRAEQSRAELTPIQTEYLRYHVQALVVVVVDGMARRERERERARKDCDVADDGKQAPDRGEPSRCGMQLASPNLKILGGCKLMHVMPDA